MTTFLSVEKGRQSRFKQHSPSFSREARADGVYGRNAHSFCLPRTHADENLFDGIRKSALACFDAAGIPWHGGEGGLPSNHLCSSQVCCVNFLYPFSEEPDALGTLLRPLYPTLREMLPVENAGRYVAFEWIGAQNYLGERSAGRRTRGANATSADAVVRFELNDGSVQVALIEWKYTEAYSDVSYALAASGTDRTAIYQHLYERADFPLDKARLPDFRALFHEPFYQLFRQQCLANEMERAREMEADRVTLLEIVPAANTEFPRVTSPGLRSLGSSVADVWARLVRQPSRFTAVSTETLFGGFPIDAYPNLGTWWEYIMARYAWLATDHT